MTGGLANNHLVGVVLVDLSKAFDSVHHDLLLCKTLTEQQIMMDQYGIWGTAQHWFHSYLSFAADASNAQLSYVATAQSAS